MCDARLNQRVRQARKQGGNATIVYLAGRRGPLVLAHDYEAFAAKVNRAVGRTIATKDPDGVDIQIARDKIVSVRATTDIEDERTGAYGFGARVDSAVS